MLAYHQDGDSTTLISYNILLNPASDFVGGGTTFRSFNETAVAISQGDAASHPSKLYHGGGALQRGVRYILVGFVELDTPGTRLLTVLTGLTDLLSVHAPALLHWLQELEENESLLAGLFALMVAVIGILVVLLFRAWPPSETKSKDD